MRLSVQTGGIVNRFGMEDGFRMISEAGFDGVDFNLDLFIPATQIRANGCYGFFDQTDEQILEALRPYKETAEKYGLSFMQAHAPYPCCVQSAETNAYVLGTLKKAIMMCGYVGCTKLVVHPGYLPNDERMTKEEEWEYNIAMYRELIPALKKYGVTCCLENMFSRHRGKIVEAICSDPYEAIRYVDTLNEIAGETLFAFCLDTGHANLLGRDLRILIGQLGERIQILHIHDNDGLADEHLFPYMGITQWDRFCDGLKDIGYNHDLNFETFRGIETFAPELAPQLLALLHATGELFVKKIKG